jgi:hypothetical protein
MGRKTARRLGSLIILLGVIGVMASIAWWENFYSPLAGQPPFECAFTNSRGRAGRSPMWPDFSARPHMTPGCFG